MTFEVIRIGLANAGMLELQCVQFGGLRPCSPGPLKSSLMRYLSNMAEMCCELTVVLANYIVDSCCALLLVAIAISAETH